MNSLDVVEGGPRIPDSSGMAPDLYDSDRAALQELADKYKPQSSRSSCNNAGNVVSILNPPKLDASSGRRVSYAERRSSATSSEQHQPQDQDCCFSAMSNISLVESNNDLNPFPSGGSRCSSSRRASVTTTGFADGIWSRLQRKSEIWEMESAHSFDDDEHMSFSQCITYNVSKTWGWISSTLRTAFTTKSILTPCVLLFVTLSVCGILITHAFESKATNIRVQQATFVAEQTDQFFVRTLERTFVPLFSMAQFVIELDIFQELDYRVGDRCDPTTDEFNCTKSTAAPPKKGNETTHRDLTDLFNSEYGQEVQKKFDRIASSIKANSGLGHSLVNIQLAPKGVVSLLYPMVNCEDFDNGYCMNNTRAWGIDNMNDPDRAALSEETVIADGVVTAGPLPLIQGGDTFIARLAINIEGGNHSMVVNGTDYPCWGFAVVLIDWTRLKEDSDIYEEFTSKKMQFKLTRTDIIEKQEVVKTIAESSGAGVLAKENITLALDAGDNGWVIAVGYDDGFSPNYKEWAYPLVICSALLFSILMMLVLVSKKQHEQILGRLLPQRAIKKMRKGEQVVERYQMVSIFFSDIVGYTKLSSEMPPEKVMKMLNDLYTKFDELADKHKVYKLETIGDAYIAIGGAPNKCPGPVAAEKVALFALDAIEVAKNFLTDDGVQLYIRAGIASGPVVAGVVGNHLPKYTIFGDTVNFAARMEQTSEKMRLQISPSTQRMLIDAPNYIFNYEDRYDENGELGVEVKGKGRQYTFWVNSAKKAEGGDSGTTPDLTEEVSVKGQALLGLSDEMSNVLVPSGLLDESEEAEEC